MKIDAFRAALAALALGAAGCSRSTAFSAPDLTDAPVLITVEKRDLPETVPVHGIALEGGRELEVNVEAEDAPRVFVGQKAVVSVSSASITCVVVKVRTGASAETGQALAWLSPTGRQPLPSGEFVSARITTRVKRGTLAVPRKAVLVREGKTFVIRQEGANGFKPVQVQTASWSGDSVEITGGLKPGDRVVAGGAIGFLYPDFKSGAEE